MATDPSSSVDPKQTVPLGAVQSRLNTVYLYAEISPLCKYLLASDRDFPRPDLGLNNGPFPIQEWAKNFPKWCVSFPIS